MRLAQNMDDLEQHWSRRAGSSGKRSEAVARAHALPEDELELVGADSASRRPRAAGVDWARFRPRR